MQKHTSLVVSFVVLVATFVSGFPIASLASTPFGVGANGNGLVVVGQSNSYSVSVTDTGASVSNAIVDVEIHDASGARVAQQFFQNQNFGTGQTQSYSIAWTPSAGGTYTLNAGVFAANWSSLLYWQNSVLSIQASQSNGTPQFSSTVDNLAGVTVGKPTTLGLHVVNTGSAASNAVVDLEVYNTSGAKVFQQFYLNQNFGAGQTQSYSTSWTPGATGNYKVDVGMFTSGWAKLYSWKDSVANVNVGATSGQGALFPSSGFYVNPNSLAHTQALTWQSSDPADAARMNLIAAQPQAVWFGGWESNVTGDVNALVTSAQGAGKTPVLVAYNIPDRDCGGFSAGGAQTADAYRSWIQAFAAGIGSHSAFVILEPDSVAGLDCLSAADQSARLSLLSYAVSALKSLGNTKVYLDGGNATWTSAATMASRLQSANIGAADGFALNTSNFDTTAASTQFGQSLSALVGGKHFVIDTSRNGAGPDGQWCNPPGRALGALPTTNTGNSLVDALLWVKPPGESDGTCNGGPSAGTWWPQYAAGLAAAAGY